MRKKEYQYPLAKDFESYLRDELGEENNPNIRNIISRISSLLESGYHPKGKSTPQVISFVDGLNNCVKKIDTIVLNSKKVYHGIVLQTLAALFIKVQQEIEDHNELGALKDIRTALVHYYSFIEKKLQSSTGGKKGGLSEKEADDLREELTNFYGNHTKWVCYTQKEVSENFKSRLHSQDRLYNRNLLFPITLIVKLIKRQEVAEKWTDTAINNIDILISKNKKTIKFENVSFFLISIDEGHIYVFPKASINGRKVKKLFRVYSRKFKLFEKVYAEPIEIYDKLQPLKSIALDHVTSMQELLSIHAEKEDVQELKNLTDLFVDFVRTQGEKCLENTKWRESHPYIHGLDILTSKTINVLANGFIDHIKTSNIKCDKDKLLKDIVQLHKDENNNNGGLELMDSFENSRKGGDLV